MPLTSADLQLVIKERKRSYLPCATPPCPSISTLVRRDLGGEF